MAPPFRAEQIGSLLRPSTVLSARSGLGVTTYPSANSLNEDLASTTRLAIKSVLASQLQDFVRPLTNGEYPRTIFYGGFFETLQGMEVRSLPIPDGFRTDFPTVVLVQNLGVKTREGVVAEAKIKHTQSAYLGEFEQMKEILAELCTELSHESIGRRFVASDLWSNCKLTMPSITWQHIQLKKGTAWSADSGYDYDKEYFEDLAAAYRQEMKTLYDAGLRYIQIDDPNLTYFASQTFLDGCKKDNVDPTKLLDLYIWAHNLCLVDRPSDLHVGVHLCRGNFPGSTHVTSGSYERFAKKIFEELDYETFYLEFDDIDRTGGFEPLRFLPRGKHVVLGLVTTKSPDLEDIDVLEMRVNEAAAIIAKAQNRGPEEVLQEQLAVSPQCGFASQSAGGGKEMTEAKMWKKLALVNDLAARIWPSESIRSVGTG